MALAMTLFPRWLLGPIVMHPSTINSTTISICLWIGTIILAFTTQIILAIPNTRSAIESRRLVYWTLLAGECFLVSLFLYQAYWSAEFGPNRKLLVVNTTFFVGHMVWEVSGWIQWMTLRLIWVIGGGLKRMALLLFSGKFGHRLNHPLLFFLVFFAFLMYYKFINIFLSGEFCLNWNLGVCPALIYSVVTSTAA